MLTKFSIWNILTSDCSGLIQIENLVLIHSDSFGLMPRIEPEWIVLCRIYFRPFPEFIRIKEVASIDYVYVWIEVVVDK